MRFDLINYIGYNGPLILILLNVYKLSNCGQHMYLYLILLCMNDILLNPFLKLIFKQPRPAGYDKQIGIDDSKMYTNIHVYGMPSGHAESCFFSIAYLWLTIHSTEYLLGGSVIGMITLYQRWRDKRHSANQLLWGGIVGIGFAYGSYYAISKKILQ